MQRNALWPRLFRHSEKLAKRLLDMLIAAILLFCLLPVFLLISIAISITSRGPLFYRQKRVGRGGQLFDICKFRTMYVNADRNGPSVTSADDTRITPIGRKLREFKLDELPQLINVLTGDMSLVGPRPQVPRFVEKFDPGMRAIVLQVRPGITGPTALYFRNEEALLADKADREGYYIQQIMPVKLKMDVEYVQAKSLQDDIKILGETIGLFSLVLMRRFFQEFHTFAQTAHLKFHQSSPQQRECQPDEKRELTVSSTN